MIFDRDYMRTREERGPLGWLDPNGSMVKALILANVAVFLLDMLSNRHLTDLLLLHPWYVSHLQLWRLVTYQFAHGGATLQEMVIPVLYSHIRREDKKQAVGVTLLGKTLNMISSRVKFDLIQSDAVSEDFKERRVLCGIYEGATLLTGEKEIVLSSTDVNPQNRFSQVDLTLTTPSSGGLLELRIFDAEDKEKLNPLAKATVINKTIIEQDF